MPGSHKITAPQLDCISHTRKLVKDRQRALKKPVNARESEALRNIGTRKAPLKNAATLQHVDRAFAIQKLNRPVLRELEHSHSLQKQRHNQELRSKRAWDVVAAEERRYVKQVGRAKLYQGSGSLAPSSADLAPDGWCEECQCHHVPVVEHNMFRAWRSCPRYDAKVLPIMIIGDKGTGVGSRIGGHARRGGTKMRKKHRRFFTPHSDLAILISGTSVLESPSRLPLDVFSRSTTPRTPGHLLDQETATHIQVDARVAPPCEDYVSRVSVKKKSLLESLNFSHD